MTFVRPDGRVVVRAHVPADVHRRAEKIARRTGRPVADVLGDFAAAELAAVLGEVADEFAAPAHERLGAHLPRNAQRPGGLTPGRASGLPTDAATSVPGDGIEPELGSGGTPA